MPFPRLPLVVAAATLVTVAFAGATEATERLSASFFLALGRAPTTAELRDWEPYAGDRMADLFARHRQQLAATAAERAAVAGRAWRDAFGGGGQLAGRLDGGRRHRHVHRAGRAPAPDIGGER